MRRILFSWELGSNLGHLARYLPVARVLRAGGHRVLFAIREEPECLAILDREQFDYCLAPRPSGEGDEQPELNNYADILAVNGFGNQAVLTRLVEAWHGIFAEFAPDLLVAQYAPASILAAKLADRPVVRVDCGFGCPPDQTPYPLFRNWLPVTREQLLAGDQRVLQVINAVAAGAGRTSFPSLPDVFRTADDILQTFPELDHYPGRRGGVYAGPIVDLAAGAVATWSASATFRIFVYLRQFTGLAAVIEELARTDAEVIAVIPGLPDELARVAAGRGLRVFTSPLSLAGLLPTADLVINHGGHGLVSASLLHGCPMLIIPQVVEQLLTAHNVERLGIGIGVRWDLVAARFPAALRKLADDRHFRANAAGLAAKYAGYNQTGQIAELADLLGRLAAGERSVVHSPLNHPVKAAKNSSR